MTTMGAGGSQCARSTDLPLTPSTEVVLSAEAAECVVSCQQTRATALMESGQDFGAAVEACDGNRDCINTARAEHMAEVADIHAAAEACLANCHNQGTGTGGQ